MKKQIFTLLLLTTASLLVKAQSYHTAGLDVNYSSSWNGYLSQSVGVGGQIHISPGYLANRHIGITLGFQQNTAATWVETPIYLKSDPSSDTLFVTNQHKVKLSIPRVGVTLRFLQDGTYQLFFTGEYALLGQKINLKKQATYDSTLYDMTDYWQKQEFRLNSMLFLGAELHYILIDRVAFFGSLKYGFTVFQRKERENGTAFPNYAQLTLGLKFQLFKYIAK